MVERVIVQSFHRVQPFQTDYIHRSALDLLCVHTKHVVVGGATSRRLGVSNDKRITITAYT